MKQTLCYGRRKGSRITTLKTPQSPAQNILRGNWPCEKCGDVVVVYKRTVFGCVSCDWKNEIPT